jgi:hypothetical protein
VLPTVPILPAIKLWLVTFKYVSIRENKSYVRIFDFFVRAANPESSEKYIRKYVTGHPKFETGVDNIFERLRDAGFTEIEVSEIPERTFPEYDEKAEGFVDYQPQG